jgi:enolase
VQAREILDSRGWPTVEATVVLAGGRARNGAVPSGASTGEREALELRDGDPGRYAGKGVLRAVRNVADVIAPALRGMDARDQAAIDARLVALDGPRRSRASARTRSSPCRSRRRAPRPSRRASPLYRSLGGDDATLLPVPLMNVINGGAHADNSLDFQEFMIVPHGAPSFPRRSARASRSTTRSASCSRSAVSRPRWATRAGSRRRSRATRRRSISWSRRSSARGSQPGRDVALALDVAASELVDDGGYVFEMAGRAARRTSSSRSRALVRAPIPSCRSRTGSARTTGRLEALTAALGKRVQLVGDDVFVTNEKILARGIARGRRTRSSSS